MNIYGADLIEKDDMVCLSYRREGYFEPESIDTWVDAVEDGGIAIDIGAYTGLYTILALNAGATMIHAFEPNPACYERMVSNMDNTAHSNWAIYQCAIGEHQGTVSMDDVKGRPRITSAGKVKDGGIIPMSTIDSMVFTHPVKAIKIDVEGYELNALKGARGTLETYHPLVIAEALDDQAENALRDYMQGLGYHVRKADDRNLIFTHA